MLLVTLKIQSLTLSEILKSSEIDGYLRGSYQAHSIKSSRVYRDDAIAGRVHLDTEQFLGVSAGVSAYTSTILFNSDNQGLIPLRGESDKSYAILGEAYVKAEFSQSVVTLGRQEIETPFAQRDDIGMIPNSFEAIVFENYTLQMSRFFMAYLDKMAGVDAPIVDKFTKLNGNNGVKVVGISYENMKDLILEAWYYHMKEAEVESITFFEVDYETTIETMSYALGLQYANQVYSSEESADIYGVSVSGSFDKLGLTFSLAYTRVEGNAANSGFGGGPFYSNSEYLIIDNAGKGGKAFWYGLEYTPTASLLDGLTIALGKVTLENEQSLKATEVDLVLSYEMSSEVEMHAIFSDLKGTNVGEDNAKHLRVFANYNF